MKTQSAKQWDEKAETYNKMAADKVADAYEYEINFPSLLNLIPKDVKRILDLGSGSGEFTKLLYETFKPELLLGTDVSPSMINLVSKKYPDLSFEILDIETNFNNEFANKFDLITCKLVLMFVEDLENVAKETYKALSQNGYLVISVPHPIYWTSYYLQNKYGYKSRPEFESMVDGYFSETNIRRGIGADQNLVFDFKFRTISTYINTFTKAGFKLEEIDEPKLTPEFLKLTGETKEKAEIPMRLNMRFVKNSDFKLQTGNFKQNN